MRLGGFFPQANQAEERICQGKAIYKLAAAPSFFPPTQSQAFDLYQIFTMTSEGEKMLVSSSSFSSHEHDN